MTPHNLVVLLNVHCSPIIQFIRSDYPAYKDSIEYLKSKRLIRKAVVNEIHPNIKDCRLRVTLKGRKHIKDVLAFPIKEL